jgi:uncharacterized BrkB/YihY/UPF0761 family membrane protein
MKNFGRFLVTTIGAYFVGAISLAVLEGLGEVLPRFSRWSYSLPIWGVAIVYIVLGYIVIELYKKLPKPKEE